MNSQESSQFGRHMAQLMHESWIAVSRRLSRSLLTATGTMLGVGGFVVISGLTATASNQISAHFDRLSATEVVLYDAAANNVDLSADAPFPNNIEALTAQLPGVKHAGLVWTLPTEITARSPLSWQAPLDSGARVMAASPGYFDSIHAHLAVGRLFDAGLRRQRARVVVLGPSAAAELGVGVLSGSGVVLIGAEPFQVIGILADSERRPDTLFSVVIPDLTATESWGRQADGPVEVLIETTPAAAQLVSRQAPLAVSPADPERIGVRVPPDPRALREQVEGDVRLLVGILAGLALVVGAFQIANASLVSMLQRIGEIGLRRALGASQYDIAGQLLLESVLIGAIGGLAGSSLGVLAIVALSAARSWSPVLDLGLLVPSIVFAALLGAAAGAYPALRAARLDPLESLRQP